VIGRQPAAAATESYDLIVIGGGAYGCALSLEAARRGLRPLLLERRDFGGATSWNSLRIVHGGLRYLQSFDLSRFRESVGERRWFLVNFADLVSPLPCLMPLYGEGLRRPAVMRLALAVNDLLSRQRNLGVQADRALPAGRILSAAETLERFPAADPSGLAGAALWYDGAMPDSQRLLVEMLRWAVAAGAVVLNYVEARRLVVRDGRVCGLEAEDSESSTPLRFEAPVVVNCAGPWCREVARGLDRDLPDLYRPSLAFNLLLDRAPLSAAAVAVSPRTGSGQTYFLHPWKGRILAGTAHLASGEDADGVDEARLCGFLDELNRSIPAARFERCEVLGVYSGNLPARREGSAELAVREVIRHHADVGGPAGLFSVSGVKFTTARLVAEKTLRRVCATQARALPPITGPARPAPQPWLSLDRFEELVERAPEKAAADMRRMVVEEAVLHLEDLLLRRTDWGIDPSRRRATGEQVARLLGWSGARTARELAELAVATTCPRTRTTHPRQH